MIARNLFWNNAAAPANGDFLRVKSASTGEVETGVFPASSLRVSGTLSAFTTAGVDGRSASFTLDFASYDGSPWVLTLNGADYEQGASTPATLPGSIALPDGWVYDSSTGIVTHTVQEPALSGEVTTSAPDTVYDLDFSSYSGDDWVLSFDDVPSAQTGSAAATAPVSLNLPAGWSIISTVGNVVRIGSLTSQAVSASLPLVDTTPPGTEIFNDGDGDTQTAMVVLDFAPYAGYKWVLNFDGVDFQQAATPPGATPDSYNLPDGWNSTGATITYSDYSIGHSVAVNAFSNPTAPGVAGGTATPPTVASQTDGVTPVIASGSITEVVLVPGVDGKKIGLIGCGAFDGAISGAVQVALFLRSGDTDTQLTVAETADHCGAWSPRAGALAYISNGKDAGESLVAKLVNTGGLPADSTTCLVSAVCTQG